MEEYKSVKKYLSKNSNNVNNDSNNKIFYSFINKVLISSLLLVITLCITKIDNDKKMLIEREVYNKNISFSSINSWYKKTFGNKEIIVDYTNKKTDTVFNETLVYSSKEDYKEGVKLTVGNNYLVPVIDSGIIVYQGNKDNYGYTIIVQQVNGIDLWYVGINNSNLKLYDYVEKGSLLGETQTNELYLYYQKDGKFIDYKEYLG